MTTQIFRATNMKEEKYQNIFPPFLKTTAGGRVESIDKDRYTKGG